MSDYLISEETLNSLANSIRTVAGENTEMTPDQMVMTMDNTKSAMDALNEHINNSNPHGVTVEQVGAATTVTYTANVTTTWTASGSYFYQDVSVSGILAGDNPIVDILPGSDNAANVLYSEAICKVFRITTSANSIRVWATEKITTAFPIQLKVVR